MAAPASPGHRANVARDKKDASRPRSVVLASQADFAGWRNAARSLAMDGVAAADVVWRVDGDDDGRDLFASTADEPSLAPSGKAEGFADAAGSSGPLPEASATSPTRPDLRVPRRFVDLAQAVICHADPGRFGFLYRLLCRLQDEPHLLEVATDPDVRSLEEMEKAVRRDIHKMRAFVRFRRIGEADGERFVAWFEPTHHIVEHNAPFFVRRFTGMNWTILTPRASASWDGDDLSFGPGASKSDAPTDDATEDLWRTYFASIFNPARLKVKAMTSEMPKKYWRNLPEASLIPDLIAGAERSARQMIDRMPTQPAPHHAAVQQQHWHDRQEALPDDGTDAPDLAGLRAAAAGCRRCPLWRDATQTVFGEGPDDARLVFVGEQPGDQEDIAGRPFVGQAGRLFDAVVADAGVDRTAAYVTNAVKHFKFEPRGKRRIHAKPNAGEVAACRWWVDRELTLIQPDLIVALGATAALSLLGKAIPITRMRGQVMTREDGLKVFLTVHPSYLLRVTDEAKDAERKRFLDDMRTVKSLMG